MPREAHHPSPSELLLSLRDDEPKPPRARSLLLAITQVGSTLSYHFLEPKFSDLLLISFSADLWICASTKPSRSLVPKDPITYDQLRLLLQEAVPGDPTA